MYRSLKPLYLMLAVLLAEPAMAMSSTALTDMIFGGITNTVDATSDATSSDDDDKLVLAARDDAARYIASNGTQRGAYLEAALQHIRQQQPQLEATDQQIAEAILGL